MSNACSIFARNPTPTATPAAISHHRPVRTSHARCVQYAAMTSSSTSIASGLLNRNINAATGVRASTDPASRPAPAPATRRTAAYSTATAPTPISACGTSTLHGFSPNIRTEMSITQSAAGVLSTVMALAGSLDPNSIAVRSRAPACAAAE